MTGRKLIFSLCAGLLAIFPLGEALAVTTPTPDSNSQAPARKDSIIVKFINEPAARQVFLASGENPEVAVERYKRMKGVEYAELNYLVRASMIPSDPNFSNQWYLKRIKAPEAWAVNSSAQNIIIAVVDSGVQVLHPDLQPNIWVNPGEISLNGRDDDNNGLIDDINGWDFVNNFADPSPKFKPGFSEAGVIHGTVVAGVAAASGNNAQGVAGVAWRSQIMSLKALDDKGDGDTAAVIKSIDYATAKGANIINLSFVGYGYSQALEQAIRRARQAGVIVVAPAGNEHASANGTNLNTQPLYPACYRDQGGQNLVIGVAATDALDQKASFSGFGSNCIDIAAPGVSFFSTTVYAPDNSSAGKFFNQYYDGYWSGTSVAVPLISGTLALIMGTNPTLSAQQAIDILLTTADNIDQLNPNYIGQLGQGRVNTALAVLSARDTLLSKRARLAVTPLSQAEPIISLINAQGETEKNFLAYRESFRGGVNLAAADTNGDGNEEIITAPVSGMEADIRIFNADGKMLSHFLAYPYSFRGGVNIAAADLDGDGRAEIITAPASGFEPQIKVFTAQGKLIRSFYAYPGSFKNGVSVAAGELREEAGLEIVTAPAKGGVPQVKVFSREGRLLNHFLAANRNDAGGLRVAVADVDANPRRGSAELIVSRQSGEALAAIYDFRGGLRRRWAAYRPPFRGDVRLTVGDLNRDGFNDIITVPGASGGPHVRIFDNRGNFAYSFYAYQPDFTGGIAATIFLTHNN